jgi:hypothetical protein
MTMEDKTFREEEAKRERHRAAAKARLAGMREHREALEELIEETNRRYGLPSIDELAALPRKRR